MIHSAKSFVRVRIIRCHMVSITEMHSGSPQVIVRETSTSLLSCPVCSYTHMSARYMQKHCKTHVASHSNVDLSPMDSPTVQPNIVTQPVSENASLFVLS